MLDQDTHNELVLALKEAFSESIIPSLRMLMDSIPIMIFYIDENEVCKIANKAFCNFNGMPIDKIIDKHVKDVVGTEFYLQMKDQVERVLKGETIAFRKSFKTRGKLNDIQGWLAPDQDLKAKILGCFCVFTEVMQQGEQSLSQWHIQHGNVTPLKVDELQS